MGVMLSNKNSGVVAIAGHVGCGHSHSLNNQLQDDSVGLGVVLNLFKEATNLSLVIKDFEFEGNKVVAILENGGRGEAIARRGITKYEKEMIRRIIGKEAINTHTLVMEQFGRMYGQGVTETPVAVQTAIANAALNGFVVNFPEQFVSTTEDYADNCGNIVGTVLNIDGVDVSVLGTVNATKGGLGPNEDLEGNSVQGGKGEAIYSLNMDKLPTIIVEAMISSSFSNGLEENTFFVRADEEDDNMSVLESILKSCEELNYPIHHHIGGMKRTKDALRNNTKMVGQRIEELGKQLSLAETSQEKVNIIADLAIAVSQDCGGISFMSNSLHEDIGGAGMLRKTSAVLNLVVSPEYIEENVMPCVTDVELEQYTNICKTSVRILASDVENESKFTLEATASN